MSAFLIYITGILIAAPPPASDCQRSVPLPYSGFVRVQGRQSECSQTTSKQSALMREAETGKYAIRRIVFIGNRHTRDGVLRRRIGTLQEGELFTRQKLIRSLKNVSKLKAIYPARLRDIVVELNNAEKTINIQICFREKPS